MLNYVNTSSYKFLACQNNIWMQIENVIHGYIDEIGEKYAMSIYEEFSIICDFVFIYYNIKSNEFLINVLTFLFIREKLFQYFINISS